jgi:hypothetical protein
MLTREQSQKLLGARLKLKRAKQHIRDFDSRIRAFKKSNPCKLATKKNPKTSNTLACYVKSIAKLPADLPVVAGDILFNLRSALDHVAMQLWLASPGRKGGKRAVQFPIASDPTEYGAAIGGQIQGARQDIVKVLTGIEAYKGGRGHQFWVLRELNNVDKHRLLLRVATGRRSLDMGTITMAMAPPAIRNKFASLKKLYFTPNGPSMQMPDVLYSLNKGDELFGFTTKAKLYKKVDLPVEVAFDEPQIGQGDSAVKTVQDISNLVADILNQLGRLL